MGSVNLCLISEKGASPFQVNSLHEPSEPVFLWKVRAVDMNDAGLPLLKMESR
jgi:hypothetical protein